MHDNLSQDFFLLILFLALKNKTVFFFQRHFPLERTTCIFIFKVSLQPFLVDCSGHARLNPDTLQIC